MCVTQRKKYQHVGIFALGDAKVPNENGLASQCNTGLTFSVHYRCVDPHEVLPYNGVFTGQSGISDAATGHDRPYTTVSIGTRQ